MLYYFYFGFSQIEIKTEAFFEMLSNDKSQYKIVAIPINKFNKNADEIWVDGKLYDVASYKISRDSVYVSVLHDKKEERLINNNTEHFDQNICYSTTNNGKQIHKKISTITDDWKIYNSKNIVHIHLVQKLSYYLQHTNAVSKYFAHVTSPPPDFSI